MKKTARSIEEIKNAYMAGEFKTNLAIVSQSEKLKEGHVVDEEQSVKWNREQVAKHNAEIDQKNKERQEDINRLHRKLYEETIISLQEDYNLNKEQAEKVQGYAYNEYHSSMHDYFYHLEELAQLMKDVIKLGAK